jgi:hypothetical protein
MIFLMGSGQTGTCHKGENYRQDKKSQSGEFHPANIQIVLLTIYD